MMRPDARSAARRAYEQHRLGLGVPFVAFGALAALVAAVLGAATWPLAALVGLAGGVGRYLGRDLGAGLSSGSAFGGLGALALGLYSTVGCCGPSCGDCGMTCMAVCAVVGASAGVVLRGRVPSLLGALPLLALACLVGLSLTGADASCAAVAALAAALVWGGRRLTTG